MEGEPAAEPAAAEAAAAAGTSPPPPLAEHHLQPQPLRRPRPLSIESASEFCTYLIFAVIVAVFIYVRFFSPSSSLSFSSSSSSSTSYTDYQKVLVLVNQATARGDTQRAKSLLHNFMQNGGKVQVAGADKQQQGTALPQAQQQPVSFTSYVCTALLASFLAGLVQRAWLR